MNMPQDTDPNALFPAGAALVVGGSGGLGDAICRTLAAQGSNGALTYHGNKAAADTVAQAVTDAGRRATAYRMPLDDADGVKAIVDDVAEQFGAIHTLVFTVGPDIGQPFVSEVTPEQ
jgi:3-oxoacyl-[acyl-carrier protein] reductase